MPPFCLLSSGNVAPVYYAAFSERAIRHTVVSQRHSCLYISGVIYLTSVGPTSLFRQARHQVGKLQEIGNPQHSPSLADDDLWIERNDVCPLSRHRADDLLLDPQKQARAVSRVPFTDTDKLSTGEWVERVSHSHKTRARVRRVCSSW